MRQFTAMRCNADRSDGNSDHESVADSSSSESVEPDVTKVRQDGNLYKLVEDQLAAVEQVLAVSCELVRRLEAENGKDVGDALAAMQVARSAIKQAPSSRCATGPPHAERPVGGFDGHTSKRTRNVAPLPEADPAVQPFLVDAPPVQQEIHESKKHVNPTKPHRAKASRGGLFGNSDHVKENLRKMLEETDAEDLEYAQRGYPQALARNSVFKNLTFAMIVFSSVWIGIDTDLNKPDASLSVKRMFDIMDNVICTYFFCEINIRFSSFSKKGNALRVGSFMFDLILVILMVVDTWIVPATKFIFGVSDKTGSGTGSLRILRLFRLVRLSRLSRLLRSFPDLLVLMRGMMMSLRSVCSIVVLLLVLTYVFSILFVQMLSGHEVGAFAGCVDNVPQAMNCLLLTGVFASQTPLITNMLDFHWVYYVCMVLFFSIVCLAVLNMLIAVVCQVVTTVAHAEDDARHIVELRDKVKETFNRLDINHDHLLSIEEFQTLLSAPDLVHSLHEIDIDVIGLVDHSAVIFSGGNLITFAEFMEFLLKFRTTNTSTMKDVVDIRYDIKTLSDTVKRLQR